ncbi:MAG TPA: hypothetical protein VGO96_06535 [Pyrinomonadaceae bacterium]|jgi:hypothetical protein|nr:hypothetical protein [Pyrinomonadaceae bacterium]
MKLPARLSTPRALYTILLIALVVASSACTNADNTNANTTATTNVTPPPAGSPSPQNLTVAERPQKIKDQMTARGEQDEAAPTLRFVEPRDGATVTGSTVNVKLALAGELKGYKPAKDPATGMGNHIHVILDNQPYEAYYNLDQPFELRNVTEGKHTLRVFASRPWHESYKNAGSFQMVTFTVKGGGDATKPTTTASGQTMADNKNANAANANANTANANAANAASANASPSPAREGKEMASSQAGEIDASKPLLTYSRPKGDYKGADADAIMIDFWLTNAKLQGDGGQYRVRYSVDGGEPKFIETWQPIWLAGWTAGKHTVKVELVDKDGNVVENGNYNSTSRDINVTK